MQKLERLDSRETDRADSAAFDSFVTAPLEAPPLTGEVLRPLSDFVRRQVGKRTLPSISDEIRRCMLMEAVRLSCGNITRAANMLGLTRQAVQQMLTQLELKGWASQLREIAGR